MKTISILLVMLVFRFAPLAAQVVYVDVVPDTNVHSFFEPYSIDLDSNGVVDFRLSSYCMGPDQAHNISCYSTMQLLGTAANAIAVDGNSQPDVLNAGDVINASRSWRDSATASSQILASSGYNTVSNSYVSSGQWVGATDKFLGVRFLISGQIHYGWIRMSIVSTGFSLQSIVKDWAYDATPNTAIIAGDEGIAGIDPLSPAFNVNCFVTGSQLKVELPGAETVSISVFNCSGQQVYVNPVFDSRETITLPVSGVYLIVLQKNGNVATQKVLFY